MRPINPKRRKNVLYLKNISSTVEKQLKELINIRGDYVTLSENFDCFTDYEKSCKLMKKKKCALLISSDKDNIVLMRCYDNQPLEIIKFKITKALSSSDFDAVPSELFVKYLVLTQNISNKKIENLFIDFFHQPTLKINVDAVKYAWVINETNKTFTAKFTRILNDGSVQDIGPYFEMKVEKEFYCGDELYEKAFEYAKPKQQKNVSKTIFKDKVGKLHIDKQDLKDVNLKKSRAYRKNNTIHDE